jgi:ribose 5-phosphate isomerase B
MPQTVSIGSDHAGYDLKVLVTEHLAERGFTVMDVGPYDTESVDYPDYAVKVAGAVLGGEADAGILICGTGIGMCMTANRFKGIRAALCHDHFTASATRRHNDANILCLGGRLIGPDLAMEIVDTFIDTPFEGGRHERRINKIDER